MWVRGWSIPCICQTFIDLLNHARLAFVSMQTEKTGMLVRVRHALPYRYLVITFLLLGACHNGPRHGEVVGTLEWERQELVAESNDPITEILVKEGDRVSKGQVILRQQDTLYHSLLEQAQARLASAQAALTSRQHTLDRTRSLAKGKYTSDETVDQALSARDMARAELRSAQAEVEERKLALQRLSLQAAADGRVDALPYKLGERPPPGAVLAILLTGPRPYARVYVPETLRAQIHPGLKAQVYIDGVDQPLNAVVRSVAQDHVFTPYFALTEQEHARLSYVAKLDLLDDAGTELPGGIPVRAIIEGLGEGD
jgi:HlyD family secretion protein